MAPTPWDLAATPLLAMVLVRLSLLDLRNGRLPDRLTLPLMVAGLALAALHGGPPWAELAGLVLGFGVFAGLGAVFFRLRGIDGLGLGDAKLVGSAGAWLGWAALPWLVLAASLMALVHALAAGRTAIAFGPWLSVAFAALWAWRLIQ